MIESIRILAGTNTHGAPVWEELPAEPLGDRCFRLAASPGLASGVAAGDEVELWDDGSMRVLNRSGNLAVQVLADEFDDGAVPRRAGGGQSSRGQSSHPTGGRGSVIPGS